MEKTGGAFLLQETQATRLVGSLIPSLGSDGVGWIQVSFFPEPETLSLDEHGDRISGDMSRAIGMALISLFHVLLAEIRALRKVADTAAATECKSHEESVHFKIEGNVILFEWNANNPNAVLLAAEGQKQLRLSEEFVKAFVSKLVDALGEFAAG